MLDRDRAACNLSPISMRALLTVRSTLGLTQLCDLYDIRNPNTLFRLAGAGYRVRSRLYSTRRRTRRWERLWVASTKPPGTSRLPIEWWIDDSMFGTLQTKPIVRKRLKSLNKQEFLMAYLYF